MELKRIESNQIESKTNNEPKVEEAKIKQDFKRMVEFYLASNPTIPKDRKTSELEIRFGTNQKNPISKINYDDTVKHLYSNGFSVENPKGTNMLRIYPEEIDTRTGETIISETRIRAEIVGLDLIQEYCNTNSIQKLLDIPSTLSNKIKFTSKVLPKYSNDKPVFPVIMNDFQMRVSHQLEQDFDANSNIARNIIAKWSDSKKTFRYINRVRFQHSEYPIFADISILKSSKKYKGRNNTIPEYTVQEAGVFQNSETYEIELEIDNMRVGPGTHYNTADKLLDAIRKCIRIILSALQGTNYPISYKEQNDVLQEYMKLVHGEKYQPRFVKTADFIGPSSYTLQIDNIVANSTKSNISNIRHNYTVTDKADGDRKLLYVGDNGRIYLINTNMNVQFSGTATQEKILCNTLIDGEHIKYDKTGKYINLYAAFDLYYINKKSVREFAFSKSIGEEQSDTLENNYRLFLLKKILSSGEKSLKPKSVLPNTDKNTGTHCPDFLIKCKEFYNDTEETTIFDACSFLLAKIRDGLFEYNTDGLIFTPANTGVGSNEIGIAGPLFKISWDKSFKWKPPEFNTIDFLVSSKKDKAGKEEVHTVFQDGTNVSEVQDIIQYKTLVLRCGFDKTRDIFINPFQSLIDNTLPTTDFIPNDEKYQPVEFKPTDPYDPNACYCNILLQKDGSRNIMRTEEGEYFEEDMIVEFKYDMTKTGFWRWIPLRVRYDKTAELKSGKKNYGNAYGVANNNWHSIHHPITEDMLSSGLNIPEFVEDDVYYNPSGEKTNTRSLRDFHNRYVKSKLISGVAKSQRGISLIDYAVGKAGDLQKWLRNNISFVFGVDISRDNIHNTLDGACARYLKELKKHKGADTTKALFVNGNSGMNIRTGEAFTTDKDKQITKAIFGVGPKDRKILGEGVYRQYGVVEQGFHISSVQFALHYFFENNTTFHNFLRNVSECTRIGGYFIGTCYDGKSVFKMLKNKNYGESTSIMKNDVKIFEITKQYSETGFPDDELCLGYSIDVFQESINKTFREYLVNFDFLIRIMENYGFVLIQKEEAQKMNLPNSSGLFSELFSMMENEIRRFPNLKADYGDSLYMSSEERTISFLNRYFVFQKIRDVRNSEKVAKLSLQEEKEERENIEDIEEEYEVMKFDRKIPEKKEPPKKSLKVRKLKKEKYTLENYSPIIETPEKESEEIANPEEESNKPKIIIGKPVVLKIKKMKKITENNV